jgi:hypothetical protein
VDSNFAVSVQLGAKRATPPKLCAQAMSSLHFEKQRADKARFFLFFRARIHIEF